MGPGITKPAHSPLGASSYYRWKACPGSIRLCRGLIGKESEFARVGTLAHAHASDFLEGKTSLGAGPGSEGLNDEDLESIRVYVAFVQRASFGANVTTMIEQKFDLSAIYPNLYGTADCVLYSESQRKLVVIDYKHGAGIPVEVEENTQLMYYGLGAMMALKVAPRSIELIVVQPRCFHPDGPIRRWITTPLRMVDFAGELKEDAIKTEDPKAILSPGSHCRFCPASAMNCPAIKERSLALAREEFRPDLSYDPKKLSEALEALEQIEGWCKSVREFAYREAEHGRIAPGFKLVAKRANRKWKLPYEPDKLAKEFGLRPPDVSDTKLKSPAQLEKIIPKHLNERLQGMVVQESSGHTLVSESDLRPSIALAAREVFQVVTD